MAQIFDGLTLISGRRSVNRNVASPVFKTLFLLLFLVRSNAFVQSLLTAFNHHQTQTECAGRNAASTAVFSCPLTEIPLPP